MRSYQIMRKIAHDTSLQPQERSQEKWVIHTDNSSKQVKTRLLNYQRWLNETGRHPLDINLAAYRDYLLQTHKETSVSSYLSSIRRWYSEKVKDREFLFSLTDESEPFYERKAKVDEIVKRIENAIDPSSSHVNLVVIQDEPDNKYIRMTKRQVQELISQPPDNLKGKRDLALISLMLATGCREGEATNAKVQDLRKYLGNELAFYIPQGKGNKQRLVPYGGNVWLLDNVDTWLTLAGIQDGYVFRRVFKNGHSIGNKKISEYSVQLILKRYPINNEGVTTYVKPHDIRRTYAKLCYKAGMSVYQIQKNLGHNKEETTKRYIGNLDADERRPPNIFNNTDIQHGR